MDLLALLLALAALIVFVLDAFGRTSTRVGMLALGLALLTASWIAQATTITESVVNW